MRAGIGRERIMFMKTCRRPKKNNRTVLDPQQLLSVKRESNAGSIFSGIFFPPFIKVLS
jgi:hypothetical protein